jgi:hypothetical protein
MKKIFEILQCVLNEIKKKFFKWQKTDISHDCQDLPILNELLENTNSKEEKYVEEYTSTTRWQTI